MFFCNFEQGVETAGTRFTYQEKFCEFGKGKIVVEMWPTKANVGT